MNKRFALLLWLGLISAGVAPLQAQLPQIDGQTTVAKSQTLVGRFIDGLLSKKWAAVVLQRAKKAIKMAESARQQRRRFEELAVGQDARLGQAVRDLRNKANVCNITADGTSVCNTGDRLARTYERVIDSVVTGFRDSLRIGVDSLLGDAELYAGRQVGQTAGRGASLFQQMVGTRGAKQAAVTEQAVEEARLAAKVEATNTTVLANLDSLVKTDLDTSTVSSGRARVLEATATVLGLSGRLVELEATAQRTKVSAARSHDELYRDLRQRHVLSQKKEGL